MRKFKKLLSILLITAILLPLIPIGEIKAYAYEVDSYFVTDVTLYKIYDKDRQPTERKLTIKGSKLKDASVSMDTNTGTVVLTNRELNEEGLLQFILTGDQVGSSVRIGNTTIDLNEGSMPTLTQVSPEVKSGVGGELILKGTNFNEIGGNVNDINGEIKAEIYNEGAAQNVSDQFIGDPEEANIRNITRTLGLQDIVFTKNMEIFKTFNPANSNVNVKVSVTYTYKNQFLLYQDIDVGDNLQMNPNRGSKGDTLFLESPTTGAITDLGEYDVFFLNAIDGTDSYRVDNRGKNRKFQSKVVKDGKEFNVLTVEIPEIPLGDYYVVLTNKAEGTNPASKIYQKKILDQKFTVIDGSKKPYIQTVAPASGPDTGSNTKISGKFLGTMNIDEFTPDIPNQKNIITTGEEKKVLTIDYGSGTFGAENEIITSAIREIKVIIGAEAIFFKRDGDWDVNLNLGLDSLRVRTGEISIGNSNPLKDVVVETTTTFHKADGTIVIRERAERKGGFRYIPSTIEPKILSIVPEKIQVAPKGLEYEIPEDRMLAIYGKNFMLHKYRDDDGKEVYRYPYIEIGDVIIDKNNFPDLYVKLFNDKGAEIDGTENNEIATKILVKLPKGSIVSKATKEAVTVQNPMRNSTYPGLSHTEPDFVQFVVPEAGTIPVINTVNPDTVSVDGGEIVTIKGNSFQGDVQVIIDGAVVTGVKRKQDGTEITFPAPKGREGETQLQVINTSGGMDTRPFFYVKTFTNPKITDFNPKMGNSGTIVMIKGENFLKADPMGTEENIFRLIGTRVFLDDLELNEYNRNPQNNRIQLVTYEPNDPIFVVGDRGVEVKPYYQGILLQDENDNNRKYTISVSTKGEITLSDGGLRNFDIKKNDDGDIIANHQGGLVHQVEVENNLITLVDPANNRTELTYITPYKIDGNKIVGQRVKVIDGETIYFTVPLMPNATEGHKDVTIINPDTKRDQKVGTSGFFFVKQPERNPLIEDIIPNEGSVAGGYSIEIFGKYFETNTSTKPKVYINAVEVPEKDIIVDKNGMKLTVVVPKYVGDLSNDKNTDRWPVPVVVLNPDGGTGNVEDGFFYVVPTSSPEITKISPVKGTAAGGNIVEIWGRDFRYFEPFDDLNGNLEYDESFGETFNDLFKNEEWDDLRNREIDDWDIKAGATNLNPPYQNFDQYYNSPILPKIYFGKRIAKILEFDSGYIKVLVPAHTPPGKVDVFLLNNDGGISGKQPYTYEAGVLAITSVVPDQGKKEGGDKVELHGTGFENTTIEIYKDDNSISTKTMPVIRLGNKTNRNLVRDHENSGLINRNKTSVKLDGGLTVEYNGASKNLTLTINEGGNDYKRVIPGYDDEERYIPVDSLKDGSTPYPGKELIRVTIGDPNDDIEMGRLLVDRGYAPTTTYVNNTHVTLVTPSNHQVGKTKIIITNPDGGTGSGDFEYKNPDSHPVITNVKREGNRSPVEEFRPEINGPARILKVNYKGNSMITVEGTDFRPEAIVKMSNLLTIGKDDINYTELPTTLSFTMPEVPESEVGRLLPILVQNKDGGSALSDELNPPIFIEITKGESNPEINTITPEAGTAAGGTRVRITGSDFRETMKDFEDEKLIVYFGDVEAQEILSIKHDSIEVIVPATVKPGQVEVRVENPDGEVTQDKPIFTYISKPIIKDVDPKKLFTNDTETVVTISGEQFLPGAKVIVGGKLILTKNLKADMLVHGTGITGVDNGGNNLESSVVGGQETATAQVEGNKIKVTFNEAVDLENMSLIVINPDGGISDPYDDFKYEKPLPLKPMILEAIPGYESTVMLIWNKSDSNILNKASNYEIYGRKTKDKGNTFVGTTEEADYLVKGLEANTEYEFLVRALNEYGSAIDFATVIVKTLSVQEDYKQKEKEDKLKEDQKNQELKGKEVISGTKVTKTLGREDIKNGIGLIDFTLSKYKGMDEYIIQIPLALARMDSTLTIKDSTLNMTINPKDLYTYKVSTMDEGDKDANIEISIKKARETNIPRGKKVASQSYQLDFAFQRTRDKIDIDKLLRSGKISLKLDSLMYTGTKNVYLGKFNIQKGVYEKVGTGTTTNFNTKGKYLLISDR